MKILLTGCAGYIGSALVPELLHEGHSVTGLDSLRYGNHYALTGFLGHPRFTLIEEDLGAYLHSPGSFDLIIHAAALVGAPLCDKRPRDAEFVNAHLTWVLAEKFKDTRVVYFNSNSGYGSSGEKICAENAPLKPLSIYGRSKCAGEEYILAQPQNLSLRLATVFGVSPRTRLDLLVNDWAVKLTRDGTLTVFEPDFIRNAVGVRDVTKVVLWAIKKNLAGVYNVANPACNLTKLQFGSEIAEILGLKPDVVTVGLGCDPDKRNCAVDSRKLLDTGFVYEQTLDEGVRAVSWLARHLSTSEFSRLRNN